MKMSEQLTGVQAARGIAALLVVVHHCAGTLALPKYAGVAFAGGYFVPFGRAGVDFFFVLSGFIIAWIHSGDVGDRSQLGQYTAKRLARIFPIYWVIFALLVAIYAAAPGLGLGHERSAASILSGVVLLPMPTAPIVGVAWTLSHEMLFYALFGLCIYSRQVGRAVVAVWAVAVVAALFVPELPYPLAFVLNVKNLEFLFGIGVAVLLRKAGAQHTRFTLGLVVAGALMFAATAWLELSTVEFRHRPETLIYGLGAALILFGLVQAERAGRLPKVPAVLRLIGDASYSIYLFHFTIVVALIKVCKSLGLLSLVGQGPLIVLLTCVATALGVVIYRYVERPLTRAAQRALVGRLRPAAA